MNPANPAPAVESTRKTPPRERILEVASDLFYRHGIRAVGVDSIAEAAGTNKMTLYRHFPSKDELVAEYLRGLARQVAGSLVQIEATHAGDPRAQLRAWLKAMGGRLAKAEERGCGFCNAAAELPERDHPARRVIEEFKSAQRNWLIGRCRAAGMAEPEMLADELFLLFEGARVSVQSMGAAGIPARFERMAEAKIAAHAA
jgi:AcrR family transcriptional regulator